MRVVNLASGSDGNLTYIESEDKKILLDMGLSCSETVKRLELIGVAPHEISAIIVSHEHGDHIKGIDVFSSKFKTPVYAHESVWIGLNDKVKKVSEENKKLFEGNFNLGDLLICPVEVPHDVKCYGFSFCEKDKKVSVVTDLGHINDRILNSIKGSGLVYLEANYDRNMLMNGTKYPLTLKRRIDGPRGHLSNTASAEVVEFLSQTGTRQIMLSHLSKENNSPDIAFTSITGILKEHGIIEGVDIKIDVARETPTSIFRLK